MKANGMGVTTLAQVNGRGASARAAASGRTKAERLERARRLMKNAKGSSAAPKGKFANKHRASFMSANLAKKRGKRLSAYNKAVKRGLTKNGARRSALKQVPFTATERRAGASFAGSSARLQRNGQKSKGKVKDVRANKRKSKSKSKSSRKLTKAELHAVRSKAAKKAARTRAHKNLRGTKWKKWYGKKRTPAITERTIKRKRTVKRKVVTAYGRYKRAKIRNPRTGRMEYSYMYRTKGGSLRRIPTKAVMAGGKPPWDEIQSDRRRASERVLKHGGVFTPNKKRTKASRKKAAAKAVRTKRRIAKLMDEGYTLTQARNIATGGKKVKRTRKKTRRAAPKRRRTSTKRRTTKRRAAPKRRRSTTRKRRAAPKRRRATTRKRRAAPKRRRSTTRKRRAAPKRRRATTRKRRAAPKRRRSTTRKRSSRMRANRRGSHRRMKRNAFMSTLGAVLKQGAIVLGGFLSHRVLTSLACDYLFVKVLGATPNAMLVQWQKPICGAGVGAVSIGFLTFASKKNWVSRETAVAAGGGVVASWLQSVVVSGLLAANQPAVAGRLEGYSNSRAYSLHGRRGGMHGMHSIMPRYQQLGAVEQAAAGFEQAAAGVGEYFTGTAGFEQAAAGIGEYFVPAGTQGVGQYEPTGPLGMQASKASAGPISDGIRPDSNLDHVLDLAEAAAGLGEYMTATPAQGGGYDQSTVGMDSQWIPNGPLWAGTLKAKASTQTSEIPAGSLASPGGNGILSSPG